MAEGDDKYGRFGAAISSGAAKVGKNVAQSEAGRSAGKAAVAGATEGVKQDLTNRYFSPPPSSPGTQSQPQSPSVSSGVSHPSTPVSSGLSHASTASHPHPQQPASAPAPPRSGFSQARPPKPSLLSRFKPHIGKAADKKSSGRPPMRRQMSNKDRVYKYNLSREANWEEKLLVQTLYNFKGEMKCDLEFRKGQVIQVLIRTDNQFDWWEGRLENRVGIFPANYVKMM